MSKFILIVFVFTIFFTSFANAQVYVRGYYKSNGTYVAPHTRTYPDGIKSNNKSYRGW